MTNNFCGNCGTAFDPNTGICPNCGARRGEQYGDAPTMKSDGPVYGDGYAGYGNDSYNGYPSGGGYSADSYGGYGYDSGSGSGRMYASGNQYAPPAPGGEKKNNTLITVLIVLGAVLVLLVAVVVLQATGVIELFGKKGKTSSGSSSRTVAAEENDAESTAVEMSLTGTVTAEDYNGNKIYVLNMESEREFHPEGKDAETYGAKLSTNKVQIVSDLAAAYVNHSVRVNGTQRYRSESGHKYDVIITDVTIEDFGESSASTQAVATTAAPVTAAPTSPAVNTQPSGTVLSATMSASTYQPHNGNRYYTPTQANDNSAQTCWMAYNPSSHGADVWISMNFGSTQRVSGIRFMNGNCWDTDADVYHLNGRVCGYTVSYDGGVITSGTAPDVRGQYTYVTFPTPVDASYITFYVNSTYWGSKYPTVVCLAEIQALS